MTDDIASVTKALEGLSSARIEALLLSRKMREMRDELERSVSATDNNDPMYRDMKSLCDDADYTVKLLENMDNRCEYLRHNHKRETLLAERTKI